MCGTWCPRGAPGIYTAEARSPTWPGKHARGRDLWSGLLGISSVPNIQH